MFRSYGIDGRKMDRPAFFGALAKYFSDATTFYVKGSGITDDFKACYESHENEEGLWLPLSQDVWTYRCFFSKDFMKELAILSERHDFPDLLEHLSLHKETELLLQWHNVLLDGKIWISDSVPEEMVSSFAQELGVSYLDSTPEVCMCVLLPDIAVLFMGYTLFEEVFNTLEEVKARGKPCEWVWAGRCRHCGQWWLGAAEEGFIDIVCLRRLTLETAALVVKENIWPSDFDEYSTLLRLGGEAGRSGFGG